MKTLFKGKGKLWLTCLLALCAVLLSCAVFACIFGFNGKTNTANDLSAEISAPENGASSSLITGENYGDEITVPNIEATATAATVNSGTTASAMATAWANAVTQSSDTNKVTFVLQADWTATANSSGFGSGTGFDNGRLHVPKGANIVLDLNGHTIDRGYEGKTNGLSSAGNVIYVQAGTLEITDTSSSKSGKIMGGACYTRAGGVYVGDGGTLTMNGGTICNNVSYKSSTGTSYSGGGVGVVWGTFTMNGGTISGNTAETYGGGVYVEAKGTFTMNGGTISGNTAGTYGGGVYVSDAYLDNTFIMNGGTISGNTAGTDGGGVYFGDRYLGNTFIMNGGTISGNKGGSNDNDVYSMSAITVTGRFTSGANIGLVNTGIITSGYSDFNSGVDPNNYFFSNCGAEICIYEGEVAASSDKMTLIWVSTVAASLKDGTQKTVTLTEDWTANSTTHRFGDGTGFINGRIYVPKGANIVLDLNGHTINRGLTSATVLGGVICVYGTLEIKDTSASRLGKITGGNCNYSCGGVYVSGSSAKFTLTSGTISGNTAGDGGGVYLNSGTFEMTGGTITGNTVSSHGSGVYVYSGTFEMTGGTISNNTTSGNYGSGVYVYSDSPVKISGNVQIKDNSAKSGNQASNVYFNNGKGKITVTGALTGSTIGIEGGDNSAQVFTSGYSTYNSAAPGTYFTSDGGGTITLDNGEAVVDCRIAITKPDKAATSFTYNGSAQTLISNFDSTGMAATVQVGTGKATSTTTMTQTAADTYTYVFWLRYGYKWSDGSADDVTVTVTIDKLDFANASVTLSATSYTYDGTVKQPTVTVKYSADGSTIATANYTVTYPTDMANAGNKTITITATTNDANFTGETTVTFEIKSRNISEATVDPIADQTYTGSAIEALPTLTYNGITLVKDTDYTLSYARNINAGTATITITGKGNFKGTTGTTFKIVKDAFDMSGVEWTGETEVTYDKNAHSITIDESTLPTGVTLTGYRYTCGDETYTFNKGVTVDVKDAGEWTVEAIFSFDTLNYAEPKASAKLTINQAQATVDVDIIDGQFSKGAALSTITDYLTTANASTTGTIGWADGTITLGSAANGLYQWVYTPDDSRNYKAATGFVYIGTDTLKDEVVGIEVINPKTEYVAYDAFEAEKVKVTYLDGTEKDVNLSECTLVYTNGGTSFLAGETEITVWYGSNNKTTVTVVVGKKPVSMTGVVFANGVFEYDGTEKSIAPTNLPANVVVDHYEYTLNGTTVTEVKNVGTYQVKVYFKVVENGDNYKPEFETKQATLTINRGTPNITVAVDYSHKENYRVGTLLKNVSFSADLNGIAGTLSWIGGDTALTADGSHTWRFTPNDSANYNSVSGNLMVYLYYEVERITATLTTTQFTAHSKLEAGDVVVNAVFAAGEGKAPANVDGWTVTYPNNGDCFLVSDNGNALTITYNGKSVQVTGFTVVPEEVSLDDVTYEPLVGEVYDGTEKTVEAILPEGLKGVVNVTYTYTLNGATVTEVKNAGHYAVTAHFTVTDANYTLTSNSLTVTFDVAKAESEITYTGDKEFTYQGKDITITTGAVANDEQTVNYTGNTFRNVDTYTMTLSVAESANYKASQITVTIEVKPAALTLTWKGDATISYDGRTHKPVLEVTGGVVGDDDITTAALAALIANGTVTVNYSNDCKSIGTHTVSLDISGLTAIAPYNNYTITCSDFTFSIISADLKLEFKGGKVTYDGENHKLEVTGLPDESEMTVTYYCNGEVFTGAKNAGTYEITAKFTRHTANFQDHEDMTATLVIEAKDISGCTVDGVDDEHIYDGKAYKPESITVKITVNGAEVTLAEGTDFTVEAVASSGASAGNKGTVKITGKGNYKGSIEKEYVIVARELDVEWTKGEYFYNGDPQGVTAELKNVVDGDEVNIEITYTGTGYNSTEMPTKAGTYTATVKLDGPYTNYTLTEQSVTFEIKMADIEVELTYPDDFNATALYDGMAMPEVTAVAKTPDGKEVKGTFRWTQSTLAYGTETYSWTFEPDDSNFNVKQGTENFNVREAIITELTVEWIDGVQPDIYTSTTLDAIRNYLVVKGKLQNGQFIEVAGYALTCDGFVGQTPSRAGTYNLKAVFNGKNNTISVKYTEVECNGLRIEAAAGKEIKTDYFAYDKFDTSTIKVVATFNDGTERVLSDTEYTIVYLTDGSETMLYGDKYVKVNYNGTERRIDVEVSKKPYDTSSWNFGDKSSTYNGNGQTYRIEGLGDDFYAEYEYYKKNANGTWTKLTSTDEVKDAGEYKIVAEIRPVGNISDNYTYPETLESMLTITKLTPDIGKPGVGGNLSVGTKLKDLTLSLDMGGITGTFVWDNEDQILGEGVNVCRYTFIPDDPNYNIVKGSIELPAGNAANGGVGGSGVSTGMFTAIIIVLVISVAISLLALIVAFRKKGPASDDDGFYDDVTDADMM